MDQERANKILDMFEQNVAALNSRVSNAESLAATPKASYAESLRASADWASYTGGAFRTSILDALATDLQGRQESETQLRELQDKIDKDKRDLEIATKKLHDEKIQLQSDQEAHQRNANSLAADKEAMAGLQEAQAELKGAQTELARGQQQLVDSQFKLEADRCQLELDQTSLNDIRKALELESARVLEAHTIANELRAARQELLDETKRKVMELADGENRLAQENKKLQDKWAELRDEQDQAISSNTEAINETNAWKAQVENELAQAKERIEGDRKAADDYMLAGFSCGRTQAMPHLMSVHKLLDVHRFFS
ncbi:hypothetical protein QBC39DRAFT_331185 [Podospora conica]|nr:hypothetical protein QBC39DRAFT_331185 [Schizothecium conicum]